MATSEESGEMNEKEKEMEENMDEVCYVEWSMFIQLNQKLYHNAGKIADYLSSYLTSFYLDCRYQIFFTRPVVTE